MTFWAHRITPYPYTCILTYVKAKYSTPTRLFCITLYMIIRCYNLYEKWQIRLCYAYHIYTTDMYEYVFLRYHVKLHVAYRLQTNHMLHQITNYHELIPAISSPCWSYNSRFYCLPCWSRLPPSAHCCFAIISHHVSASTSVHRQHPIVLESWLHQTRAQKFEVV